MSEQPEVTRPGDELPYWEKESRRNWDREVAQNPLGKLHLAEALLARYDVLDDGSAVWGDKREWLRGAVAGLLRLADPAAVLQDLTCIRLVRRLWANGVMRLEMRAKQKEAA